MRMERERGIMPTTRKMTRTSNKLALALLLITTISACSSYRILGVFPHNSKSHNIVFEALMKGLAKHGHQVDVISHYPQKKAMKNYNDIVSLAGMQSASMNNVTVDAALQIAGDTTAIIAVYLGNHLCDLMGLEKIQRIVKNPPNDPPYDLVVTEAFGANCFMGIGHVLKVPVVAVSSGLDYPWISYFTGNDDNLAYVPNALHYTGSSNMNFYDKLMNVVTNYHEMYKFQRLTYNVQTESMRRYLDPDVPDIRQIERNVALTLINTHPVLSGVKPVTPALIQIAGVHIEMNDEILPPDLQRWMNESTDGVVYFSLGAKVLLESFPERQLKQMYSSFAKISPVRVLAKVVNSTKLPAGLPANVKIMSWIQQQPVLAHPNIKVFINHGGLGSIQETLYYGIPMIGIPLFADQFRNVEDFVARRMAIKINFDEISESTLDSALQALLHESIYKEKAMYYSKLYRDTPISPMNNTVFWIEYVIRNGPDVLRSPALQFSFVQLALLDVYGFLLLIAGLFALIVFVTVKFLIGVLRNRFVSSKKVKAH